MHNGVIVERGDLDQIFYSPSDPYTRKLLGAVVRLDAAPPLRPRRESEALLEVTDLVEHFPVKRGLLIDREVDRSSSGRRQPQRRQGETLGLVGSPQRQVDAFARDSAVGRAELRLGPLRGARARRPLAAGDAAVAT